MPETDIARDVLRMFSYGLYVAAAMGADGPRVATVSWVSQASFEPRLVAVAMRKGTSIYDAVSDSRRFALHVVGSNQHDFAKALGQIIESWLPTSRSVIVLDRIKVTHGNYLDIGKPVMGVVPVIIKTIIFSHTSQF